MNGTWYNLPMLSWLWLLPVLLVILWLAAWRVRRQLNRWLPPQLRPALTAQVSGGRRWCANFLWLLALALLVIALARPAWHAIPQDVHSSGRDVVFLLDVSKSMLAEDLKPNRLERAKLAIDDCVNVLNGDRVALVVFAGGMVVKCPLTQDYGFFRMMLTDVSTDSVSRGGTLIGDALRKIRKEVFDGVERKYRDIVLITDGEDHESFPQQAAEELGKEGIRLLAVGLGDEAAGSSIMVPSEQGARSVMRYHGEVIKTKLDSRTLRNMASATPGGRYLPVGTGNFDLGQIYQDLIATAERRELESQTLERYEEKFQIFLGAGMIMLALSMFLGDRRSVKAMAGVLLLFCLVPGRLAAAEEASKSLPDSPYECYNLALESYRRGEFQAAKEQFQAAADKAANLPRADRKLEAKCRLGAGNASYRLATGVQSEPGSAAAELKEGIDDYARAEELSPDLAVVKENKRVARLVWKKLLQQQRQQQQQQAQQRQQQKNDLDNLAKRQEQAAEQSSQAGDDKQKQQQAEQQQEQLNQDTEKMAQQTADNQAVQEKIQEAQEHQQKAMEKMKEQKMEEAAEEQRQAARSLQEAGEESQKEEQQKSDDSGEEKQGEDQQQAQGQEQQGQEQQQQQAGQEKDDKQQEESREQGELSEDAHDILEEERKARRLRVLPRQGQIKEVDKDW